MGFSRTINCIGFTKTKEGNIYSYHAMNRREVCQARLEAQKRGLVISYWIAQTMAGRKILGMAKYEDSKDDKDVHVMGVHLIECPKCKSKGCQICHWAGQTIKTWLKRFLPWQLEPEK
ncbi:MAG: hypothetical protein HY730_08245 [Candidatus Tectomicrobia bacterium]|uniref:Uncharacterized protein n=1 Tax=Tectimicrobiota bacterium TaxID=2528274 RepID=A0A933GP95_UNCTE|nr:hypothetical protein [Candidatus Tectomicrobia bacterium]